MDQIRKFDSVLNKEYWDIVANQIEIAFPRVELNCETADIAGQIGRTSRTRDCRKAHKTRRLYRRVLQKVRLCMLGHRLIHLKLTVRRRSARMYYSFRNPFMIEMGNFLA